MVLGDKEHEKKCIDEFDQLHKGIALVKERVIVPLALTPAEVISLCEQLKHSVLESIKG